MNKTISKKSRIAVTTKKLTKDKVAYSSSVKKFSKRFALGNALVRVYEVAKSGKNSSFRILHYYSLENRAFAKGEHNFAHSFDKEDLLDLLICLKEAYIYFNGEDEWLHRIELNVEVDDGCRVERI